MLEWGCMGSLLQILLLQSGHGRSQRSRRHRRDPGRGPVPPHCPPDPLLHGHSIRCEENTPFDLRRSRACELRPFSRDRLHTGVWWGGGGGRGLIYRPVRDQKDQKCHRDYHRCVTAYATACLKAALLRLFGANWAAETLRLARRPCDFRRVCT